MNRRALALTAAALAAWLATGCESVRNIGVPWVTQGPGITPEEARARRLGQAPTQTPAPVPSADVASRVLSAVPESPPAKAAAAPARPVALASAAPSTAAAETSRLGTGYTQAARHGDLLFISGQIAMDLRSRETSSSESIEEQTRLALENVRVVLEANRLSMANLVATTIYLKNINDLPAMDRVYSRYFNGPPPARTVVEVSRLPRGALVEISAIAGR